MKKTILLVLVLALCMATELAKADFTWMQKADMLTPRWGHTSAVVNGKIYVIGGASSQPDEIILPTVEEYDPATDTWIRKTDMLSGRSWMSPSSPVVDGKIYVIGAGPKVEMYDPVTDTWTRKTNMPTSRDCLATVAVDGKIYAIGGAPPDEYTGLKTVEMYNPVTDTWTRKADLIYGVWYINASVVRGKIYVLAGRPDLHARPWVQEYDPSTDTWTQKSDMPIATSQMGSVVLDDKIIVIGGWEWSLSNPYTTVQMYDPETDTWTIEGEVPFQRAVFTADVVRGRIFAIGGTDRPHPCPATSTVYECDADYIPQLGDFNSDGKIDKADMHIMIDHWGENYNLCDIEPLPFGDGIVDIQDMIVLAENLYRLSAHWKLDETEGSVAYDSFGDYDGTVNGNPFWQPTGGTIGGSLMLDGMDDYIDTPFVLNPSKGSFSVFAWVYCWMPGQVIISQKGESGGTWLGTNPSGKLMTGFSDINFGALKSESVITDIQWHHVAFVYDMDTLHRRLYVDGILVAEDTSAVSGVSSESGLNIGVSKDLDSTSFFSGFIDDVRIYNQAMNAKEIELLAH